MVRKSLIAMVSALSLVSATAHAAPVRVASPIAESEGLTDDDAWILPVTAILFVILLVLLDGGDDDEDDLDRPTSP